MFVASPNRVIAGGRRKPRRMSQRIKNSFLLLIKNYHVLADCAAEILSIVRLVIFSLSISLLAGVLLFVDQTQDALRVVAEEWHNHNPWPVCFLLGATGSLAAMSWYCARVLVYQLQPAAQFSPGCKGWAARQIPRICGCAVWFALFASCRESVDIAE